MRTGDAPEKWQERSKPTAARPKAELSLPRRIAMFVLFLAFVAAGLGAYVFIGRETTLAGSLPLPARLKTTSRAHEDLLLFGRELGALAVDVQGRLPHPDPRGYATVNRLLGRLGRLTKTGRDLAPLVSREESRALYAFEHGEHLLGEFIRSTLRTDGSFDPAVLRAARAQIDAGMAIARGKSVDDLVTSELSRLRRQRPRSGVGPFDFRATGAGAADALSTDE